LASAAGAGRMILGNASPWLQLDLPWDEAPGWDGIPRDREEWEHRLSAERDLTALEKEN